MAVVSSCKRTRLASPISGCWRLSSDFPLPVLLAALLLVVAQPLCVKSCEGDGLVKVLKPALVEAADSRIAKRRERGVGGRTSVQQLRDGPRNAPIRARPQRHPDTLDVRRIRE